jgi:hypothetical protein
MLLALSCKRREACPSSPDAQAGSSRRHDERFDSHASLR